MNVRRAMARTALGVALGAGASGCATTTRRTDAPREADWGPIFSRRVEPDGTERVRALGPVVETVREPDGSRLTAVRPFFVHTADAESGWVRRDWLWPVASSKRLDDRQASWRVLIAWGQRFDLADPEGRWRLWVLPVYFQGRDAAGDRYLAVFPLGGRIREILMQDEIAFALWPLWVRAKQGATTTQTLFWPLASKSQGAGVYRARLFPFYGVSRKSPHVSRRFILWPFWTEMQSTHPSVSGSGFMVFPLYGRVRMTDLHADTFVPPFFRFVRSERQTSVNAPWPFVQIMRGEVHDTTIWPLFRSRRRPGVRDGYLLWVLFNWEQIERRDAMVKRWRLTPLLSTETHHAHRGGRPPRRDVRLWPLVSYRREEDAVRMRMLELWPVRDARPVEAAWAPFWTLAEWHRDAQSREVELLWGMFRHRMRGPEDRRTSIFPLIEWERRGPEARSWNLLKGLVGYRRDADRRRLRLLYALSVRLGRREEMP